MRACVCRRRGPDAAPNLPRPTDAAKLHHAEHGWGAGGGPSQSNHVAPRPSKYALAINSGATAVQIKSHQAPFVAMINGPSVRTSDRSAPGGGRVKAACDNRRWDGTGAGAASGRAPSPPPYRPTPPPI